jgi:Holliday junction DNA helicase RuvA
MLRGTVAAARPEGVVLDVGGVGYLVRTVGADGFAVGADATFHTYLAVRENAMDLYGFASEETLRMFECLIELPKIGPKSALQILSQADVALIHRAVAANDPTYLSKLSGIGKKSAEKIVTGLRDMLEGFGEAPDVSGGGDIVDALIALGYSAKDARDAVGKLSEDATDDRARIREALRLLSS